MSVTKLYKGCMVVAGALGTVAIIFMLFSAICSGLTCLSTIMSTFSQSVCLVCRERIKAVEPIVSGWRALLVEDWDRITTREGCWTFIGVCVVVLLVYLCREPVARVFDGIAKVCVNILVRVSEMMVAIKRHLWTFASERVNRWTFDREPSSFVCRWFRHRFYRRTHRVGGIPIKPLYPLDYMPQVDSYAKMMTEAMSNERVLNIAVSGRYGAGKSSFLRTYFRNVNVLWVSLASFMEVDDENDANTHTMNICEEFRLVRRLEWSILQQLFYTVHGKELPFSRFRRIFSKGRLASFILAFVVTLMACGVVCVWKRKLIEGDCSWFPSACWGIFPVAILLIFALVMFFGVYKLHRFLAGQRLSLGVAAKGLELHLLKSDSASVFNRIMDEVVYYFETLKYEAVVFEDIDRFRHPIIFAKLREINQIVNQSRQVPSCHKPIRFIYALRDDVFTANYRVKFFDFILPIYPVMNAETSYGQIERDLKEILGENLNEKWQQLVRCVAPFMNDMRFWNNICNEFRLCHSVVRKVTDRDRKKILAMIMFKNFFPTDFGLVHEKKGLLFALFSMDSKLKKDVKVALRKELDSVEGQKRDLEFLGGEKNAEALRAVEATISAHKRELATLDFQSMKDLIANRLVRRNDVDAIVQSVFTGRGSHFEAEAMKTELGLLFVLIEIGVLDERYGDFTTLDASGCLPNSDVEFIRKCLSGEPISGSEVLKSPFAVIERIDELVLSRRPIYHIYFARALRSAAAENKSDRRLAAKLAAYQKSLAVQCDVAAYMFVFNLLHQIAQERLRDYWMLSLRQYNARFVVDAVAEEAIDSGVKISLLAWMIGACERASSEYLLSDAEKKLLEGYVDIRDFVESVKLSGTCLLELFAKWGMRFSGGWLLGIEDEALRGGVISRGLYIVDPGNIVRILMLRGFSMEEIAAAPYGCIIRCQDELLCKRVDENFSEFITTCYPVLVGEGLAEESMEDILPKFSDETLSDAIKEKLLSLQRHFRVDVAESMQPGIVQFLLKHDVVVPSWGNLSRARIIIGYGDAIREFTVRHLRELSRAKFDSGITGQRAALVGLCEDESIREQDIGRLTSSIYFQVKLTYSGVEVSSRRLETLARSHFVKFSVDYYEKLRKDAKGLHLVLARFYPRQFAESYRSGWLSEEEALALLEQKEGEDIPLRGIIALRRADELIQGSEPLKRTLGGYIRQRDFEGRSYYSERLKCLLINYMPDSTCRAYAMLKFVTEHDEAWELMRRFPGVVISEDGQCVSYRISVRVVDRLRAYLQSIGFKVRISGTKRMPEIFVSERSSVEDVR